MGPHIKKPLAALVVALAALAVSVSVPAGRPIRGDGATAPQGRHGDQEALKAYAPLVGSWRGTGQVERGRARGAWTESAIWSWKLSASSAALELTVTKGKHLKSGLLRPGREPGTFVFEVTLADDSKRTFTGKPKGSGESKPLVLSADAKAPAEGLRRVTLTPLHDTRLLVLLETEDPERHTFNRLGEVGYTREGIAFAAGESYPLCIVTEGRGTTPVTYKGKTYWVCCSGCRDLFNDDPEGVLSEAAAREKAKKK
jgi:YHS domain-containing protein